MSPPVSSSTSASQQTTPAASSSTATGVERLAQQGQLAPKPPIYVTEDAVEALNHRLMREPSPDAGQHKFAQPSPDTARSPAEETTLSDEDSIAAVRPPLVLSSPSRIVH